MNHTFASQWSNIGPICLGIRGQLLTDSGLINQWSLSGHWSGLTCS